MNLQPETSAEPQPDPARMVRAPRRRSAGAVSVVLALGGALLVGIGFRALGVSEANTLLVFLVAVAAVAFYAGRGASIATAVLAVVCFNFFFTQPLHTLAVADVEYLFTFAVLMVMGILVSELVARLREEAARARAQAEANRVLYRVGRAIASTAGTHEIAARACAEILRSLGAEAVVFPQEADELAPGVGARRLAESAAERRAALAALAGGGEAGAGTRVEPAAQAFHVELPAAGGARLGTLGIRPAGAAPTPGERRLTHALAAQLALALGRERVTAAVQRVAIEAEAERLRANLLATVSHDLRTPLAAISGAASAMLDLDAVIPESERKELLGEILSEADRLTRMVENLLQLVRLDDGKLRLVKDWYPIEELAEAALARVQRTADTARIRLELPPEPPLVPVDAELVENLLVNLLDNALRHAPEGPITLAVATRNDELILAVSDTGPGLPPGDPERLFQRFFRGGRTRGSGLGLAICRAAAAAHGGTLTAGPAEGGRGAVFTLVLPLDGGLAPLESPGPRPYVEEMS